MVDVIPASAKGLRAKINKGVTLFLFLLLPKKITNAFITLSIIATIFNIRDIDFRTDQVDVKRLNNVLKIAVNNDILLLPNYTIHLFWDDKFLNNLITVRGNDYALIDIIRDKAMFITNIRVVMDKFIENLPPSTIYKLDLTDTKKRFQFKYSVMRFLVQQTA